MKFNLYHVCFIVVTFLIHMTSYGEEVQSTAFQENSNLKGNSGNVSSNESCVSNKLLENYNKSIIDEIRKERLDKKNIEKINLTDKCTISNTYNVFSPSFINKGKAVKSNYFSEFGIIKYEKFENSLVFNFYDKDNNKYYIVEESNFTDSDIKLKLIELKEKKLLISGYVHEIEIVDNKNKDKKSTHKVFDLTKPLVIIACDD